MVLIWQSLHLIRRVFISTFNSSIFYLSFLTGTNLGRTSRARTKIHICVAQTLRANGVSYTWPATRTPQGLVESPMPETMVEASMDAGTQKVVQFKMQ